MAFDGRVPGWGHALQRTGHLVGSIGKLHYGQVGRVMTAVERAGLSETTSIVYTSDNGAPGATPAPV